MNTAAILLALAVVIAVTAACVIGAPKDIVLRSDWDDGKAGLSAEELESLRRARGE